MILEHKYGIKMNLKKIARIKREYGLITKIRKKNPFNIAFKKGLEHRTAPNLLKQNFKVNQPDKVYSTDISYLFYHGGKRAYLSATKDLATKEIVAFNISKELDLYSTYGNFAEFLKSKDCSDLIIHSDQGWHVSKEQRLLRFDNSFGPRLALYSSILCQQTQRVRCNSKYVKKGKLSG